MARHPTEHNIILGILTLLKFGAIQYMIPGFVKFHTVNGLMVAITETQLRHKCYYIMVEVDITRGVKRPREEQSDEKEVIKINYP